LLDLINIAITLDNNYKEQKTSFLEEPGEIVLLVQSNTNGKLSINLYKFQDWIDTKTIEWIKENGKHIFSIETSIQNFQKQLFNASHKLLEKYEVKGYKNNWTN